MRTDGKQKMVSSALELFREHGYSGTGFREVVAHAGGSRGSIYHYFPGGKAELGVDVMEQAGEFIAVRLHRAIESDDPLKGLDAALGWWIRVVEAGDYRAGCPVVAVAAESHEDAPELVAAAAAAFDRWERILAAGFRRMGMPGPRARDLAALWVGGFEGATVMCRAAQSSVPLARARRELGRMLDAAFADTKPATPAGGSC